jgi:hypothetical protein
MPSGPSSITPSPRQASMAAFIAKQMIRTRCRRDEPDGSALWDSKVIQK